MRDLISDPEGRLLFTFAVPMLIGNLFRQLCSMVDSVVSVQFAGGAGDTLLTMLATPIGWAAGMILLLSWYAGGRWKRKALAMGAIAARRQSHG